MSSASLREHPPAKTSVPQVWLIRFAHSVEERVIAADWFVLGLCTAAWLTLGMLVLVGWSYEYQYITKSWQVLMPDTQSVGVIVPMIILAASLLFLDTFWGAAAGIITGCMYVLVQLRTMFPDVAWRSIGHAFRTDAPLYHAAQLIWHTLLLPSALLLSLAIIGQLTGPSLHAGIRVWHGFHRARIQQRHLAWQRAFEEQQLRLQETQELALAEARAAEAAQELELRKQARALSYQRAQAQLTMERVQVKTMTGTANSLLEQLLAADDPEPQV